MTVLAACQPAASNAVELAQSPAGLDQAALTISSNQRDHAEPVVGRSCVLGSSRMTPRHGDQVSGRTSIA